MPAIAQPPVKFESAISVFEQALLQERAVTKSIHDLYALAMETKDYPARVFLDWFVNEQVEEEKTAELIVEQLKMVGEDRPALLLLDRELGQRKGDGGDHRRKKKDDGHHG
jgi:ferritin